MESNRLYYEFLRKINSIFPPYEVFDKYKDDIEGLAAYMINEHPDKKDDIEKIVKQYQVKRIMCVVHIASYGIYAETGGMERFVGILDFK